MNARTIARYGLMLSLILVLGLMERQFVLVPGVPGIRLGLSNTVLMYALYFLGAGSAWLLMGLKVLLGGFLYGGVSGMLYSLAGGLCSMAVMCLVLRIKGIGMPGVSVVGAVFHTAGQLTMSRLLLGTWAALAQSPLLIVFSVLTGVLTGVAAKASAAGVARLDPQVKARLKRLQKAPAEDDHGAHQS